MGRIYELTYEKILHTDSLRQTSDEKDGANPKSAQYCHSLNPESRTLNTSLKVMKKIIKIGLKITLHTLG